MNQIKQTAVLVMIFLLSACAAPTTNAPATLILLSPTLPVIVSETSTPEPLTAIPETPGYLDLLNINWSDSYEGQWGATGPHLVVSAGMDSSLFSRGKEIQFKEYADGNNIIFKKAQQLLRAIFEPESKGSENGLADFAQLLSDVQSGKPGVEVPTATFKIFNANGSGAAEEMTLVPDMGGKNVPAGAHEVTKVSFVFGDWSSFDSDTGKFKIAENAPWFKLVTGSGDGGGPIFDKETGTLYVMIGIEEGGGDGSLEYTIASDVEIFIELFSNIAQGSWLSLRNLGKFAELGADWSEQIVITH